MLLKSENALGLQTQAVFLMYWNALKANSRVSPKGIDSIYYSV